MSEAETQAGRIIRICGVKNLARWTRVSVTQVYRWDHPKEKGGAAGKIPSEHHQIILNGAQAENIQLTPADFFDVPDQKGASPLQPLTSCDGSTTSNDCLPAGPNEAAA